MLKRFLEDTLDLILTALSKVGLLRGGPEWYKLRLKARFMRKGREAENVRRGVAASHRMCRECRSLVERGESTCPTCGAPMSAIPRGGAGRALSAFAPSLGSASTVLFGVIAVVYLAGAILSPAPNRVLTPSPELLNRLGAMNPRPLILQGEWWRIVNPIFLHGGLLHVGFNCYVLSSVGPLIESVIGARKFLVLFMATGIASFIFSAIGAVLVSPHWSVGASGAIFGLLGFGIAAGYKSGYGLLRRAAPNLVFWVAINFVIGMTISAIDNSAHLGGFLTGAVMGLVFQDDRIGSPLAHRAWGVASVVFAVLPIAGLVMALLRA